MRTLKSGISRPMMMKAKKDAPILNGVPKAPETKGARRFGFTLGIASAPPKPTSTYKIVLMKVEP